MSLRMPRNLSTSPRFETGLSVLEAEIAQERSVALGRLGRAVESALARLSDTAEGTSDRSELVRSAADAVWEYFVQREASGMMNHAWAITHYAIPREVLAAVGAR